LQQREPTPAELELINKEYPTLDEARQRGIIMNDPLLANWRNNNPGVKRGGYIYGKQESSEKSKKTKLSKDQNSASANASASTGSSSGKSKKNKHGGKRTRKYKTRKNNKNKKTKRR
jgi:hypothetical protein